MKKRIIWISLIIVVLFCLGNWWFTKHRALSYYLENAIKSQHGLTGFYYYNRERFGKPDEIRIDPEILFDNNLPYSPKDNISICWTGLIYLEKTGRYTFGTFSDDGSWLYIDHRKIIDNGGEHGKRKVSNKIFLWKGYHTIELHYNEHKGKEFIQLYWRPPGGVKKIVPSNVLIPVSENIDIHKTDRFYTNMLRWGLLIITIFCVLLIGFNRIKTFFQIILNNTSLPLLFIIITGTALRFYHFGTMEFKPDESVALFMVKDFATLRNIPLAGLFSSVGIWNPPLFIYLLTIPFLICQDPLFITGFITITNIAAIFLCYVIGRKFFNKTTGIIASALFAVSPWAVVFSRKLWSQDFLPVFSAGLLYLVLLWVTKNDKRKLPFIIIILACMLQLHYSALAFILLLILIYVLYRPSINIKYLSIGILVSFCLFIPFIIFQIKNNFHDLTGILGAVKNSSGFNFKIFYGSFIKILQSALNNINHYNFSYHIGDLAKKLNNPFFSVCAATERYLFIIGLVYIGIKSIRYKLKNAPYCIIFLWFIMPIIIWAFAKIPPLPHYSIVLYPAPFLIIGITLSDLYSCTLRKWTRPLVSILVAIIAASQIAFIINFYSIVETHRADWGDFGLSYKCKRDVIKYITETAKNNRFTVSSTGVLDYPHPNFSFESLHPEYWYLLWLYKPDAKGQIITDKGKIYHFAVYPFSSIPDNLNHLKHTKSKPFGLLWMHQFESID